MKTSAWVRTGIALPVALGLHLATYHLRYGDLKARGRFDLIDAAVCAALYAAAWLVVLALQKPQEDLRADKAADVISFLTAEGSSIADVVPHLAKSLGVSEAAAREYFRRLVTEPGVRQVVRLRLLRNFRDALVQGATVAEIARAAAVRLDVPEVELAARLRRMVVQALRVGA